MSTSRRAELARLAALSVPKSTPARRRHVRVEAAKDALRDQAHYFVSVANKIGVKRDAAKEALWKREAENLYHWARNLVRVERRSR